MSLPSERHPAWLSRRTAIRALGWLLAAPMPFLFASTVQRHAALARQPRRVTVPRPVGDGVTIVDDVIVSWSEGTVRVFSARCTHLGCRIDAASSGVLVCPCHGSRFHVDGSVAAGPASRPLDTLPFSTDARTGALIVDVS